MPRKPLTNILVKPAGADCNMACEYCFYLKKCELYPDKKQRRMSDDTLSVMVEQLMALGGEAPSFGWQGGEPTLMGIDFYKRVVEYQKKYGYDGQTVGNGLQTNGLVIDREWADFIAAHEFLVGLSLDGPKHVHDHYRCKTGGGETWERVVQTAKTLMERDAAVNALIVVSDYSSQFPEEIYDFHRELGFDFLQFVPIVETSLDGQGGAPFSLPDEAFGEFFIRIFDRWVSEFRDGFPTTSVRWFDSLLYTYVGLEAPECPMRDECGVYLCVEHTGDVYPCDFFVEEQWKLGNVHTDRLDHLLNCAKMNRFARWKRDKPEECDDCKWYPQCFGGCTKDRVKDPTDKGMNHFCKGTMMFLEHADPIFKRLAARWKRQQMRQAAMESNQPAPMPGVGAPDPYGYAEPTEQTKIARNAPCPCGSGKKYKKCCGKN